MKTFWLLVALSGVVSTEFIGGESVASNDGPAGPRDVQFDRPRTIAAASASNSTANAIRVLTWNIDRGGDWQVVKKELKEHPSDLLLLQEVDWNTNRSGERDETAELAKELRLNASYAIEFEELSQERDSRRAFIGQATLTGLPVRNSRVLRFEHQSGFWRPHSWLPSSLPLMQRRLGSRVALVSELDFAGKLLVVYNVHLESRSYGRIQVEQLDELLSDMARFPPGTNAILGGDLNTKYFPSIFLKKLQRAGFQSALGDQIQRTHTIAMALDWIFVRGNVRTTNGEVRKDLRGSDHYPIFSKVESR